MWFFGIQMTQGPARINVLCVAFVCLTFQWLMQGQCLCVNLPTPLTKLPSAVASHTSWDYQPDAEATGPGTFCWWCVINVFDSTLNLDHLKSLAALWGTHARGALCGMMLFHLPSVVALVSARKVLCCQPPQLVFCVRCICSCFFFFFYPNVSQAKLHVS